MSPEEAASFFEDDEDPAEIFRRYDQGPRFTTCAPGLSVHDQVLRCISYICGTYGKAGG